MPVGWVDLAALASAPEASLPSAPATAFLATGAPGWVVTADPADSAGAVVQELALGGEGVLPGGIAFVRQVEARAGGVREFAGARGEVGVDVGFGDARDAHPLAGRRGKIRRDIAIGIDHDGLAGGGTADEIARLCDGGLEETGHDHGRASVTP